MRIKKTPKTRQISSSIMVFYLVLLYFNNCQSQSISGNSYCNRKGVDKSVEKAIPKGICIPTGYTVDKVVTEFDFNQDTKDDVALRYSTYPLVDGTMRCYAVYEMVDDTTYIQKKELTSLATPYISMLTQSYLKSHPKADSLASLYPTNIKINFKSDTILVSHYLPDYYGKTYVFPFNTCKDNWYLTKVRYWIGELPIWLIQNGNLKEELYGRIYLNEDKLVSEEIKIEDFNLIESKRKLSEESEYLMNNYDVFSWSKE